MYVPIMWSIEIINSKILVSNNSTSRPTTKKIAQIEYKTAIRGIFLRLKIVYKIFLDQWREKTIWVLKNTLDMVNN